MSKPHRTLVEFHQRHVGSDLQGLHSDRLISDELPGLQHLRQALAVVQRHNHEQLLRVRREIRGAGSERVLEAFGQRHEARHQPIFIEAIGDRWELDERKRIARRLAQDARTFPRCQRAAPVAQQASRRRQVEGRKPKLWQLPRTKNRRVPLADSREQDDRIRFKSARDETENIDRGLIQPMGIFGDQSSGPSLAASESRSSTASAIRKCSGRRSSPIPRAAASTA